MQILRIRKDAATCAQLLHVFSPFIHDLNAFFAPVGGLGLTNRKICFRQQAANFLTNLRHVFAYGGSRALKVTLQPLPFRNHSKRIT